MAGCVHSPPSPAASSRRQPNSALRPGSTSASGDGFEGNRYLLISTFNSTTNLYARVNNNGSEQRVDLGAIPTGQHQYRIEWTALDAANDQVRFYVDGQLVADMTVASAGVQLASI
ncbi:MAG: family 16 glycosylhydrolase [Caldilineaceae bacterium]